MTGINRTDANMTQSQLRSFEEFWPFYLGEHSSGACRWLHFVGTTLGLVIVLAAIITASVWLLLAGIAAGYAFAWIGHAVFEKNKPATFKHPWWSFRGDWKMWLYILTGRMRDEYTRLNIRSAGG